MGRCWFRMIMQGRFIGSAIGSGVAMGSRKSKDLTQRTQRKGGEKSEKDKGVYRRDAEGAEKGEGEPAARLTSWQAGAQPACGGQASSAPTELLVNRPRTGGMAATNSSAKSRRDAGATNGEASNYYGFVVFAEGAAEGVGNFAYCGVGFDGG